MEEHADAGDGSKVFGGGGLEEGGVEGGVDDVGDDEGGGGEMERHFQGGLAGHAELGGVDEKIFPREGGGAVWPGDGL